MKLSFHFKSLLISLNNHSYQLVLFLRLWFLSRTVLTVGHTRQENTFFLYSLKTLVWIFCCPMRPKGPIPVYLCLPFSPLILKTCSHASGVLDLIWTLLIQHLGQNFEKWNPIPNNFLNFPVGRRNFLLLFLQMNVLCTKMKTVSGMAEVCGCSPACSVWIWHCIQLLSHYFILGQAVSLGGLKIPMLGTQSLLFKMWQKGTTSSVENLINGMKTFFKEKKTKQKKPQRPPEILLCS